MKLSGFIVWIVRLYVLRYLLDVLWGQPIKLAQGIKWLVLQNCMKINKTTLFSSKSFPLISAGPQKPQKLTASKIKYERFGPKI